MENLTQVTLLLKGQPGEVRFVEDVPAEGDVVMSEDGDNWIVVAVDTDGLAYSVFCEPLDEKPEDAVP